MNTKRTNKLVQEYVETIDLYEDYAELVASLLKSFLTNAGIPYYTIEFRVKGIDNLREKIQRKRLLGREYIELEDITDLAGVRVILYFLDDVNRVREIVQKEFKNILKLSDYEKAIEKRKNEVGYSALHELVRLIPRRSRLNEYKRFKNLVCEIQIKSVLQHAWSEIEHDIGYKPKVKETDLERSEIRKLFKRNADLLQKVDQNFVTIREKHVALLAEYTAKIERHKLQVLPINYDTVRAYLIKQYGQQRIAKNVVLKITEMARVHNIKNIFALEEYIESVDYKIKL